MPRLMPRRSLTVAHLSDLHVQPSDVGDDRAIRSELWRRLWERTVDQRSVVDRSDLCIVSGDLASSSPNAGVYEAIKEVLENRFPDAESKSWIVVPGNHDRRRLGNFLLDKTTFDSVFPNWKRPWWDADVALIVIPVDSNPDETHRGGLSYAIPLARGCVSQNELERIPASLKWVHESARDKLRSQLDELSVKEIASLTRRLASALTASELERLRTDATNRGFLDEIRHRLAGILASSFMARASRAVVLHHHPVGIADTENLGLTEQDVYLTLSNAGDFVRVCRTNRISLILHGHKHAPYRMVLGLPGNDIENLGVIGSGSTTLRTVHGRASGNEICVNKVGEVQVSMFTLTGESWERSEKLLTVRPWSQVRRHLATVATENSQISCEQMNVYARILSTGDAVVTRDYLGLTWRPSAVENGKLRIAIGAIGGGNGNVQCQASPLSQTDEEHRIGRAEFEPAEIIPGRFDGYVSIPVPSECGGGIRLSVRFTTFAAFAMNSWQSWLAYGRADAVESYDWNCSIPVRKRMTAVLSAEGKGFFRDVRVHCSDIDDDVLDAELRSVRVHTSPGSDAAYLHIEEPVWGARYGLEWHPHQGPLEAFSPIVSRVNARNAAVGSALADAPDASLEVRVFEPSPTRERDRLILISTADDSVTRLPVGAGVAGRAAWLGAPVFWCRSRGGSTIEALSDFYLPVGGSRHTAAVALPLLDRGSLLGVLSVASRTIGTFEDLVRSTLQTTGRRMFPSDFNWIALMAERLVAILRA
jgi:3',5'-cyclic AMP phosphodiesterase CpdA